MTKILCLFIITFISFTVKGQDTTRDGRFAPGTLVGKYYGTYDTSAKKKVELPATKAASSLQVASSDSINNLKTSGLAKRPQLQVNQNYDPIEISGTRQATGLNINSDQNITSINNQSLSSKQQLQVNQNFNPIEVSGTTQASGLNISAPQTESIKAVSVTNTPSVQANKVVIPTISQPVKQNSPYRDTRLGSSSPEYNTYRTNDNGAGSVTTNQNKGGGIMISRATTGVVPQNPKVPQQPFYRDTRLGSSSPEYNTYQTNDYGAGSVTTNQNKGGGGFIPTTTTTAIVPQYSKPVNQTFYRDTRLGSSSPQYDTYRKNDNGAGAVTTNPNKSGGYILPELPPIQPEQTPVVDSTASKPKAVTSR